MHSEIMNSKLQESGMRYIQFRFVPLPVTSLHRIIAAAFGLVK